MPPAVRPEKENICALIITYYPDDDLPGRARLIANQVGRVLIIDNNSPIVVRETLLEISSQTPISLILNPENLGVATALNQGMAWAKENGCQWILALDQDSIISPYLIERYQSIYDAIEPKCSIGILASNFLDPFGKDCLWRVKSQGKHPWIEVPSAITSGTLLSRIAFDHCGTFRDDLFIDMVDTEYCLRLRSHNYRVYMSREPLMTHPIGTKSRHKLLCAQVFVSNHSAVRKYYITRNRLVLAAEYLFREPAVVLKELRDSLYSLVTILFYESDKLNKYRAICLGISHALHRRMGKLEKHEF